MDYQNKAVEVNRNIAKVIVGKEEVTKLVLTSIIPSLTVD